MATEEKTDNTNLAHAFFIVVSYLLLLWLGTTIGCEARDTRKRLDELERAVSIDRRLDAIEARLPK
jgi:hypothetical protein